MGWFNPSPKAPPVPVDNTDDWWTSKQATWIEAPPIDRQEYRIMRAKKTNVEGAPGFIVQWHVWARYSTKSGRDAELAKLSKAHPKWRLKAAEGNPYYERLGYVMPKEGINT